MKLIRNILDKNLQNVDEKDLLETGKDQRSHCLFSVFLPFVLLTFLLIYIPIFPPIWTDPSEAQIEDYLSTQYTNEYYPTAEAEIQKILLTAANISDPIEKLTTIAAWEIEDFVDTVEYNKWNESYNGTRALSNKYYYDENGKIRVFWGKYQNDPHWIAYHKIGACGELAALFEHVANRSGFETRQVFTLYAESNSNHAWVEVKVNGEWMYFDPTIYWNNYNNEINLVLSDKWYGTLDEQNLWGVLALNVYDSETGKDVCVERYPNIDHVDNPVMWWYYAISRKITPYLDLFFASVMQGFPVL